MAVALIIGSIRGIQAQSPQAHSSIAATFDDACLVLLVSAESQCGISLLNS